MILDHFLPTLALDIRNIGRRELAPGPLGRVGAEIVCDDTLVQYAAYLALFLFGGADGIIRFRSFWWGWRFTSFFKVSLYFLPWFFFFSGGAWEDFFLATLLISGVVDLPCEVP